METLGRLYGDTSFIGDPVSTACPRALVGALNLGGASEETVNRVCDALTAANDRGFVVKQIDVSAATQPKRGHDADDSRAHLSAGSASGHGGAASASGHGGSVSAGGRSAGSDDAGRSTDAASPASPSVSEPPGILRGSWIRKHRTEQCACFLVIEEIAQLPSTERIVVEQMISHRLEALRHRYKAHSQKIVLALVVNQKPSEQPGFGGYAVWDDAVVCIRKTAGLSDSKHATIVFDADADTLRRSLRDKLTPCIVDALGKYHVAEGLRIKRKLKSDKVNRYAIPRMLTIRIRFKVAWHYEAARDSKLSAHNYLKGYEEVHKLPPTLEALMIGDALFFRYMQLQAGQLGVEKAAADIDAHLTWLAKYDADTLTVIGPDGFVTSPAVNRHLARLLHTLTMAEANRRFGLLMLRVAPFEAGDPRGAGAAVVRHFNGPLLEAGALRGTNAGTVQFLYGSALSFRRARSMLRAIASLTSKEAAEASAPAPPVFPGQEPSLSGTDAAAVLRSIASNATTWKGVSETAFEVASLAMPIAQQVGMRNLMGHLSSIMAEHYQLIGNTSAALAHNVATNRSLGRCPLLRDRAYDFAAAARGDGTSSDASVLQHVKPSIAFTQFMYDATRADNTGRAVALTLVVTTTLPTELRFARVEAKISRAVEVPPEEQAQAGASLVMRPAPQHATEFSTVLVSSAQPLVRCAVAPATPITLAGMYVVEKLSFWCADGAKIDVPVDNAEAALGRMHSATSHEAPIGAGQYLPGLSRHWFPPGNGLPVCRVWQPPPQLHAAIVQPPHAIEGERHLVEVRLHASGPEAIPAATLRIASHDAEDIEPVVGLEGEGWGPWVSVPGQPARAECYLTELAPGATVAVPVVLLCRTAGQFTLPMSCAYSVSGVEVAQPQALTGALSLHVLHPVFAHLAINDTLLSKVAPADVGNSSGKAGGASSSPASGVESHTAPPTDAHACRFIECAENTGSAGGGAVHHGKSYLAHSHPGLRAWAVDSLPTPPKPQRYHVNQRHCPDGRGGSAVPRVTWQRPFWVGCRLSNNLHCRLLVESIMLEAHDDAPLRVLHAADVSGVELDVDEECDWHASMGAVAMSEKEALTRGGTLASQHVPRIGTMTLRMRRLTWGMDPETEEDEGDPCAGFENRALAAALLASSIGFEIGLPPASVEDQATTVSIDYPAVATLGSPFGVTLTATNAHPIRPALLKVAVGDGPIETLTQAKGGTGQPPAVRGAAVDLAGKVLSTLVVPPQSSAAIQWRACAGQAGHLSLPAILIVDSSSSAQLHTPAQHHAVFVVDRP